VVLILGNGQGGRIDCTAGEARSRRPVDSAAAHVALDGVRPGPMARALGRAHRRGRRRPQRRSRGTPSGGTRGVGADLVRPQHASEPGRGGGRRPPPGAVPRGSTARRLRLRNGEHRRDGRRGPGSLAGALASCVASPATGAVHFGSLRGVRTPSARADAVPLPVGRACRPQSAPTVAPHRSGGARHGGGGVLACGDRSRTTLVTGPRNPQGPWLRVHANCNRHVGDDLP
jgi:hypothetical protein